MTVGVGCVIAVVGALIGIIPKLVYVGDAPIPAVFLVADVVLIAIGGIVVFRGWRLFPIGSGQSSTSALAPVTCGHPPEPPKGAGAGMSALRHIDFRVLAALFVAWLITLATASWIVSFLDPTISPVPSGGYTKTTGIVEATYPSQHDTVRYSYAVNGEVFEATWAADGPEGHASSLKLGQQITVWYETNNPARSCSCSDPHELQRTGNDPTLDDLALDVLITTLFLGIASRVLLGGWLEFIDLARSISSGSAPEPPEGR